MTIRVVVVEDAVDVRRELAYLLDAAEGFLCVGQFGDAESAIAGLERSAPDVVLMDIGLPGMSGIDAVGVIRQRRPDAQVMMLTIYEDEERIFESLRAGATGYVLKATPGPQLLEAISALQQGGSPISSRIARRVVAVFQQDRPANPAADLTSREQEILQLLIRGHRYREIADRLTISLDTVRTHIRHIYEKMQVRTRTEATARVLRWEGNLRGG